MVSRFFLTLLFHIQLMGTCTAGEDQRASVLSNSRMQRTGKGKGRSADCILQGNHTLWYEGGVAMDF